MTATRLSIAKNHAASEAEAFSRRRLWSQRSAGSSAWTGYALFVLASVAHEREGPARAGAVYRPGEAVAGTVGAPGRAGGERPGTGWYRPTKSDNAGRVFPPPPGRG